jgi:hypothetical protein
MRHWISGLVAAVAVMASAPAMACGYTACAQPQVYVAPVASYGCNPCGGGGGWVNQRLAEPEQQYYYVNQGPTYSGPGNYAPAPVYREGYVSGGNGYAVRPYYRAHRHHYHHRAWHPRVSYHRGYAPRAYAPRHAYAPRYAPAPYHHGQRVLRRYY